MKIDLTKLEEQIALGNVNAQTHPRFPELRILKYSKQAVYTQAWNEITLLCRGLAIDAEGNVVVNCMPKFGNHNDMIGMPVIERNKNLPYTISVKEDGSLIQIVKWNSHLLITSSGSMDSPQVHMAARMLLNKYPHYQFKDGLTYILELIEPSNRIVLDYGDRESLVLLAIRNTETGEELPLDPSFECTETVNMSMEEVLKELPRPDYCNKEGWVLKWSNGERVKFKLAKYCLLHQVISGVSSKWIWECLKDRIDYRNSLIDVPDELMDWCDNERIKYQQSFSEVLLHVKTLCGEIKKATEVRKEQAEIVFKNHKPYAKFIFGLLDGKDISNIVWKSLEPKGGPNGSMRWGAGVGIDEE